MQKDYILLAMRKKHPFPNLLTFLFSGSGLPPLWHYMSAILMDTSTFPIVKNGHFTLKYFYQIAHLYNIHTEHNNAKSSLSKGNTRTGDLI